MIKKLGVQLIALLVRSGHFERASGCQVRPRTQSLYQHSPRSHPVETKYRVVLVCLAQLAGEYALRWGVQTDSTAGLGKLALAQLREAGTQLRLLMA